MLKLLEKKTKYEFKEIKGKVSKIEFELEARKL